MGNDALLLILNRQHFVGSALDGAVILINGRLPVIAELSNEHLTAAIQGVGSDDHHAEGVVAEHFVDDVEIHLRAVAVACEL